MIRRNLAWILLGLSVVLNVFFVGGFVYAQHFGPPWAGGHPPWQPRRADARLVSELNLDPGQQHTLRQAFREMRRRNAGRVRELVQLREQIVAELRKDKLDPATIDPLLDRVAAVRSDIQKDGLRTASEIAATLRPEQREKFRELVIARTVPRPGPGGRPGMIRRPPEERRPQ
jgi:uncharacterized membrane protein